MIDPNLHEFNFYQAAFDLAPVPMWIYDLETSRFLKVNKETINKYGYSEKEFLNMSINQIRLDHDNSKPPSELKKVSYKNESPHELLVKHQKRDGSILQVLIKSNQIIYGQKRAAIVTVVDLTNRYIEESRIYDQDSYLTAIDEINQVFLNTDNRIRSLNACFNILGHTLKVDRIYQFKINSEEGTIAHRLEWRREHSKIQIHDQDFQNIPVSTLTEVLEPLQKKYPFDAVIEDLSPSVLKKFLENRGLKYMSFFPIWVREVFWGFIGFGKHQYGSPIDTAAFPVLKTVASHLGHLLKSNEMYHDQMFNEVKFESLIENGKDLITIVDAQGEFMYVSPSSESVFGIPPIDLIGKNAFDLIHEKDVPAVKKHLAEVIDKKMVSTIPYRFPDAQGNWHWVRTELSNHLNSPSIKGIVANTIDVTAEEKKKMVDHLLRSLTVAISSPGLLSKSLKKGMDHLVQLDKICASEIWLISSDENRLDLVSKSYIGLQPFYKKPIKLSSVERGDGLPGATWNEQRTLVFENIYNHESFLRSAAAKSSNLRTAVSFPLSFNNEFFGCIVCFSQFGKEQLDEQIKLLSAVIGQLGAIVKQKITDIEFYNFFNISPNPHAIIGFDCLIKKCNRAFVKLLGYKESTLINQAIFGFVHDEDQDNAFKSFNNAILGINRSKSIEARFLDSQGTIKTLVWSGISIPESKVFVVAAQDVTEQKHAERDLKTTYERLRTANKMAKMGYWIKDYATNEIVWGEETYNIYECSPDSFTPTMESIEMAFHPEDRYLIKRDPRKRLEPGKVETIENRIITNSGKIKWVRQEIRLVTNDLGQPYRIEGTIKDITERKKYEDELAISNQRFKMAMQASHEIIWEVNHLNKKVVRGKSHKNIFTFPETDTFTEENLWLKSIHVEDRERVWKSINNAFKNKGKKSWRDEYRLVTKDGSILYLIDRCYIIRDDLGNPVRSIGSILDVTSSREQLEQIKRQNDNLREIAWLQSHVTRSPLSKIMGLTYLSKEFGGGGKTKDEIIDLISEAAYELDDVIRDITNKINIIRNEDTRNIDH